MLFSGVACRGYSLPLQRIITDFGAEVAFGQVNERLKEHYGIEVSTNGIREVTLKHANGFKLKQDKELGRLENKANAVVISETDGSMVPVVQPKLPGEVSDRRKGKTLGYREARLTLAHAQGSVTPLFSATMGGVQEAGRHIKHCVKWVGMDDQTKIHSVGDGAPWIAEQVEEQFGSQAKYLIDFYHLCEYLSAAAARCAPNKEKIWMESQKKLLKENQAQQVLLALMPFIEDKTVADSDAPVRVCHRYISNRLALNQLDYQSALVDDLPIGSGEIESAHRYVIQKRLKLAGAWWLEPHADRMLALRVARANKQWGSYWKMAA